MFHGILYWIIEKIDKLIDISFFIGYLAECLKILVLMIDNFSVSFVDCDRLCKTVLKKHEHKSLLKTHRFFAFSVFRWLYLHRTVDSYSYYKRGKAHFDTSFRCCFEILCCTLCKCKLPSNGSACLNQRSLFCFGQNECESNS